MVLLKILIMLVTLLLLALPFLPVRIPLTLCFYNYPEEKRPKNIRLVGLSVLLTLLVIIFLPRMLNVVTWFTGLPLVNRAVQSVPTYAAYSFNLLVAVLANLLYCLGVLIVFALLRGLNMLTEWIGRRRKKRAEKKNAGKTQPTGGTGSGPQQPAGLPAHLKPLPEQPVTASRVVLESASGGKAASQTAAAPRKSRGNSGSGGVSLGSIVEVLIRPFYQLREGSWYVRPKCKQVARHLRNFLILTGALYLLGFLLMMIPVFFQPGGMPDWFYRFTGAVAADAYFYPAVSMVLLTEIFWLLNGRTLEEAYAAGTVAAAPHGGRVVDLDELEKTLIDLFGKTNPVKVFFSDDVDGSGFQHEKLDPKDPLVRDTRAFIESQNMQVNDDYVAGLTMLRSGRNVLFDAPLYTAVGSYLYMYLNTRIASGERIVVICQHREELETIMDNMSRGFQRVLRTHTPLWRIIGREDLHEGCGADILVLTPEDFGDAKLLQEGREFFGRVNIALLPDADRVVRANNYYCLRISEMLRTETGREVQYLFLSTRNTLNLANSLYQYFNLREPISVATGYYSFGSLRIYIWKTRSDGVILLDNGSQEELLEAAISDVAADFGITNISIDSGGAIYPSQISQDWLEVYDAQERPIGFLIIADDRFNLPSIIYAYARYIGKQASVLHIISRPYLLQEYFIDHAPRYLYTYPEMQQCIAEHADLRKSEMVLLLSQLMGGMPLPLFEQKMQELTGHGLEYANFSGAPTHQSIGALVDSCITEALGTPVENVGFALMQASGQDFDPVQTIRVRDNQTFQALLESTRLVEVRFAGRRERVYLDLFKRMMGQRYLRGQNIVYNHRNYEIRRIDYKEGILYVDDANAVHGIPGDYLQLRNYVLGEGNTAPEICRAAVENGDVENPHADVSVIEVHQGDSDLHLTQVYLREQPIASDTRGYYMLHSAAEALDLTSGTVQERILDQATRTELHRTVTNAYYFAIDGEFQRSDSLTMTMAVLLQEIMKTMFPQYYFCISVCPILAAPEEIYNHRDSLCRKIAGMYPRLEGWGAPREKSIELLIVDDCQGGTGILDVLFQSEGVFMGNVVSMLYDYMLWVTEHPDRVYYYFGSETEPAIFSSDQLRSILQIIAHRYEFQHDNYRKLHGKNSCAFCRNRLQDPVVWQGKLNICRDCDGEYRPDSAECGQILDYILEWLRDSYGEAPEGPVTVETLPLDQIPEGVSNLKIEERVISLAEDLPLTAVHLELLRQTVRLWQVEQLTMDGSIEFEGHVSHTVLAYLTHLEQHQERHRRYREALVANTREAEGFRLLIQGLQSGEERSSFAYMRSKYGQNGGDTGYRKGAGITGRSTRNPEGKVNRLLYGTLGDTEKTACDRLLSAVEAHTQEVELRDCGLTQSQWELAYKATRNDHPEIFWWDGDYDWTWDADKVASVSLVYTMTREERQKRQEEIDGAAEEFLSVVTPEMGDFETALRIYEKMVELLDYDTLRLEEQDRIGGPQRGVPDDLRTIYGALVEKRAVCAGYARAYQYLLNRLGMDAIYVSGDVHRRGAHAWNIIRMEGESYHVDVTWGDHSNTNQTKKREGISYEYFGITDKEICMSRSINQIPQVPACTATACNYYIRTGLYFERYDYAAIRDLIIERFRDPAVQRVELRFSTLALLRMAEKQLVDGGGIFRILSEAGRPGTIWHNTSEDFHVLKIMTSPEA